MHETAQAEEMKEKEEEVGMLRVVRLSEAVEEKDGSAEEDARPWGCCASACCSSQSPSSLSA